ncbi:MAG: tetratricopeptide repeat protein [Burkholderiaceae bacterium]
MAHLDLEEQEQLDQLRAFWRQWGNLITWLLIAVLGAYAAWNGFQWWQRSQAAQAAGLYEQVDEAARGGDVERMNRAFDTIRDKAGSSVLAQQAGLLTARTLFEKEQTDAARAALTWVADKGSDTGLRAIAKLRLAALLTAAKSFDAALAQLGSDFPAPFAPLVADQRGDVLSMQGNRDAAVAEYRKALAGFGDRAEYRRLVEIKLTALGVNASASTAEAKS